MNQMRGDTDIIRNISSDNYKITKKISLIIQCQAPITNLGELDKIKKE